MTTLDQRGRHLVSEVIRARRRFARTPGDPADPRTTYAAFLNSEAAADLAAYLRTTGRRVETRRHAATLDSQGRARIDRKKGPDGLRDHRPRPRPHPRRDRLFSRGWVHARIAQL
jgi:hypothetical protein